MRLRGWTSGDAAAVLEAFRAEDMRTQSAEPIATEDDAVRWMESWAARGHAFAVVLDDEVVGNVAVTRIDGHGNGWVSYWTTARARGRGVAARAANLLAEWAFEERGLYRLELGHRVTNPASCRVAVKAGFLPEGVERGKLVYDGVRHDVERHARLATD
ncbi:GNAT family N-acetyltransferase [Nonomuraea mangrovi]|uniref:GNAT family N-acetyltransferase n=1 Tax=Nonomuraea mangrovi TaxID=2316207 RepID=A0ABW4T4X1_9ACTN